MSILEILGAKKVDMEVSEEVIEVEVKPKHFKSATINDDSENNPLANALKDHFKTNQIVCGDNCVTVNGQLYSVVEKLEDATEGEVELSVDQLIRRAKNKQGVGEFLVLLEKINITE